MALMETHLLTANNYTEKDVWGESIFLAYLQTVLASTAFANAEYYGFGRSDSANLGFLSMEKNKILIKYSYTEIKKL
jgi:hypothetical protein